MVIFESGFEAFQNLIRVMHIGFDDVDFLKAPRQCAVFVEYAAIFLIGRGSHATNIPRRQHRLQQVGCIHHAARCGTRTDDGVHLIDEQDRTFVFLELSQHHLEAFLEVAAILRAGQQGAQI